MVSTDNSATGATARGETIDDIDGLDAAQGTPGIGEPATAHPEQLDTVELRVRASAAHLSAVRAVAGDLAMHLDMDLDTVADLRLAVDEACSALVPLAQLDSTMSCRFTVGENAMTVVVAVRSISGEAPTQHSFAWQVLTTLADEASSAVHPDPAGGYQVSIALHKRRFDAA